MQRQTLKAIDFFRTKITPDDPLWYGAWWIGFIIAGLTSMTFCAPMIGFSPRLPGIILGPFLNSTAGACNRRGMCFLGSRATRKQDIDQGHGVKSAKMSKNLRDFPKEIWVNFSIQFVKCFSNFFQSFCSFSLKTIRSYALR